MSEDEEDKKLYFMLHRTGSARLLLHFSSTLLWRPSAGCLSKDIISMLESRRGSLTVRLHSELIMGLDGVSQACSHFPSFPGSLLQQYEPCSFSLSYDPLMIQRAGDNADFCRNSFNSDTDLGLGNGKIP